jgi:hypothetical protein
MRPTQLNFAPVGTFKKSVLDVLLMGLAAVSVFLFYDSYTRLQQSADVAHRAQLLLKKDNVISPPSSASLEQLAFAKNVQADLNTPWMKMLQAIEAVKQQNPHIEFTSIQPNKSRQLVSIKGVSEQFEEITQLVESLNAAPVFSDAMLMSQHVEQDDAGARYVFELSVAWPL